MDGIWFSHLRATWQIAPHFLGHCSNTTSFFLFDSVIHFDDNWIEYHKLSFSHFSRQAHTSYFVGWFCPKLFLPSDLDSWFNRNKNKRDLRRRSRGTEAPSCRASFPERHTTARLLPTLPPRLRVIHLCGGLDVVRSLAMLDKKGAAIRCAMVAPSSMPLSVYILR